MQHAVAEEKIVATGMSQSAAHKYSSMYQLPSCPLWPKPVWSLRSLAIWPVQLQNETHGRCQIFNSLRVVMKYPIGHKRP